MSSSDEDGNSMTEEDNNSESPLSRPIWQLMYFLLMWQTLYRVSNAALKVLLKFLSLFVLLFGRAFAPAAEYESLHRFATGIPHSIQNGHKLLREMILSLTLFVPSVILYMSMMIVLSQSVERKNPKM